MMSIIKRLIRYARITRSGTNGQQFFTQQIEYLGKAADTLMVYPYGMHANLPPNDTLTVTFSIEGHAESRASIGWTPQLRPDLESGEVAYYHPFSNSLAIFRNNGDIDIDTVKDGDSNNININTNDLNITVGGNVTLDVTGDVTTTVGGSATIDVTGNTDVTTPLMTLNGDMQVNGTIDATGIIHSDIDVTGPSISLESHTHLGSPSAPSGPVSNTGLPQ